MFKALFLFFVFLRSLLKNTKFFQRNFNRCFPQIKNQNQNQNQNLNQKHFSLHHKTDLSDTVIVFNVEGTLLKSSSFFPYFMLVAFEAGSLLRALVLLLFYPLICTLNHEMALSLMAVIAFFGVGSDKFRAGRSVLPKFFLEDVGLEAFHAVNSGGVKVAVTDFPQIMVESFLKEYLQIDYVVGRKMKTFRGLFLGLMEPRQKSLASLDPVLDVNKDVVVITSAKSPVGILPRRCREIYLVRNDDKASWQSLQTEVCPKPLVFHDGRLAVLPTPLTALAIFMWLPFGVLLLLMRAVFGLTLPMWLSIPLLQATGARVTLTGASNEVNGVSEKGMLYACNHRTLFDPLVLSFSLRKPLTAVTYSVSRFSEMLSPIRTVRLTRDRDLDGRMMEAMLGQGDLVVCPEGTTCREPYLLRFSPLFAVMSDRITPVALNSHVGMFYGTTAGGWKFLDPIYFFLNPCPVYTVDFLPAVQGLAMCRDAERSKFEVANHVQRMIGDSLGFKCTFLTRRDKYMILAGNEGIV